MQKYHFCSFCYRLATRCASRERGKTKKQVLVAVMRKLLHIAYGIRTSGRPYDPQMAFPGRTVELLVPAEKKGRNLPAVQPIAA
jgi:hypothetical protein